MLIDINKLKSVYDEYKIVGEVFLRELKDSSIDINEKWELYKEFSKINNHFKIDYYYKSFKELDKNNIEYYDDFYYDRHRTIIFIDLVERIEEILNSKYNSKQKERFEKIDLNDLKKEIIETELTGCLFDW